MAAVVIVAAASAPFVLLEARERAAHRGYQGQGAPACPPGHAALPDRTARIYTLLEATRRGRELLQDSPQRLRVCFRPGGEAAITAGGIVILDERPSDAENAARLGHLLMHATQGSLRFGPMDRLRPCRDVVADALTAEAQAHALELELRRALGVTAPQRAFPFEKAFWEAPAHARVDLLRQFFLSHPQGAPGVPGFVNAYRRRCAELRDGTSRPAEPVP